MILLIGGVPRTGKSTLALNLAARRIPVVSTDPLAQALHRSYPSLQLHDGDWTEGDVGAAAMAPMLRELAAALDRSHAWAVIEGDLVTPHLIADLAASGVARGVVLGTTTVTVASLTVQPGDNDWVSDLSPEAREALPARLRAASAEHQATCAALGVPWLDTGLDRAGALATAEQLLTADP